MDTQHAVSTWYDGEGVYAWGCTCGEGETDHRGDDFAVIAGAEHLDDMGMVPTANTSA